MGSKIVHIAGTPGLYINLIDLGADTGPTPLGVSASGTGRFAGAISKMGDSASN